jgi:caffeoyl-CoA O-methyltransferase
VAPITAPEIEAYIDSILPAQDPLLAEVEAHARQHRLPIVGPAEGRFLYLLARLHKPRRILELGACSGYSALWLAAATADTGATIETIELDLERQEFTARHIERSPHAGRITLIRGNALEVLPGLSPGTYDLIFNDLLRSGAGTTDGVPNQVRFLELSVPLLRPGGVLLSDNVLCGGEVAGPQPQGAAAGIAEYNRRLSNHPELETSLVPIRDGVAISIRYNHP